MPYVIPQTRRVPKKQNDKLTKRKIDGMLKRLDMKSKIVHGTEKKVWPDEKRVEAVNLFLTCGSMQKVSDELGIPVDTLRDWRKFKPWWKELENVLREERDLQTAGEMESVTERAIAAVADRIKNGDFIYNPRSGELTRVPVKADTLNKIASSMIDKKLTLQKQPTKYTSSTDDKAELTNKLAQLAKSFASFTTGRVGKAIQNELQAQDEAIEGELVS